MNSNSDELLRQYQEHLTIEYRFFESQEADTTCTVFGKTLSTPIMLGGLAHYEKLNPGGGPAYAEAAKKAGSAIWTGFTFENEIEEIIAVGAPAARIIKPFADKELIFQAIDHDKKAGACAIAMDIDHVYNKQGRYDSFFEKPLAAPTKETLREIAKYSDLPFFMKGILSVKDAEFCADAGIAGIVVSQHQNMFPWCVPTLKVLPEIRKAVGDRLTILCDSCLDTGYECFKALALGADAVFTVRPMMPIFREKGADGVAERLTKMTDELRICLSRTGAKDIHSIDPSVIRMI